MGEIELKAENKIKLRAHAKDGRSAPRSRAHHLQHQDGDGGGPDASEGHHEHPRQGPGWRRTKEEFFTILPVLGFDKGGTDELGALFDDFDADGSGVIDFEELHRLLRKEFSTVDDDDEKESVPVR